MACQLLQFTINRQLSKPTRPLITLFGPNTLRGTGQLLFSPRNQITKFHQRNSVSKAIGNAGRENGEHITLFKPLIFTIGFTTSTFVGVTICEYERLRLRMRQALKKPFINFRDTLQNQQQNLTAQVTQLYQSLSQGDRFFVPICALNLIVFALWSTPRFKTVMSKYFLANPAAKAVCWPMLLSTFSHYSGLHLFANMFVLHSFANGFCYSLGTEQAIGVYLSAGVIASLASYFYKAVTVVGGASLGASGAIMALLAYTCTAYPNSQLSIILLPMFSFSAGMALKVIIGLDVAGCILGWKFFDHAAHLGGALFGLFWYYVGKDKLWPQRRIILDEWHKFRKPPQP